MQSIKGFFRPSDQEPPAKKTKQLSISSFAVPVEPLHEEEILITKTVGVSTKVSNKNHVGRPRKPVDLNLEEFHDFNDMLKQNTRYDQSVLKYFLVDPKDESCSTRKRYSMEMKEKIRKHYNEYRNYAKTAAAFNCSESTIRGIIKKQLPPPKDNRGRIVKGKANKGNKKGGGKPLSYPKSVEDEILQWLFVMMDQHLPASRKITKKKAASLIIPHNPDFVASNGWFDKFCNRNRLSLRKRTSLSQKLPHQLEEKIKGFYLQCAKAIKIGKYPLQLIGNMDETPMWFDIVPQKTLARTNSR